MSFGALSRSSPDWDIDATAEPTEFDLTAGDFLRSDPVRHTVVLSNVAARVDGHVHDGGPAHFFTVRRGGAVVGAAMRTGRNRIYLTELPLAAVDHVADTFAAALPDSPGVDAPEALAARFAERWTTVTGARHGLSARTRLFRLGELRQAVAPGAPRRAADADLELCVRWLAEFGREVGQGSSPNERDTVRARLRAGRLWLWEDRGRPVAMVGRTSAVCEVSRVAPVYTPPVGRGNGYAGALTSHVSRVIRERGEQACLFTDLANPTSNRIYQAIGYRPVADRVGYDFG